MNLDKKLELKTSQSYSVNPDDVIIIKVKDQDEFRYKIPEGWSGSISISMNGTLTEVIA